MRSESSAGHARFEGKAFSVPGSRLTRGNSLPRVPKGGLELALTVLGPVANLALASGAITILLLLLHAEPMVFGATIFGFYALGLTVIYAIMRPVLRLLGLASVMKVAIALCLFAFLAFLSASVGGWYSG